MHKFISNLGGGGRNDAVSRSDYMALVVAEWNMSMQHWWNDSDSRKPKYLEKNLFQCHSVHHKSQMDRLQWEASD